MLVVNKAKAAINLNSNLSLETGATLRPFVRGRSQMLAPRYSGIVAGHGQSGLSIGLPHTPSLAEGNVIEKNYIKKF